MTDVTCSPASVTPRRPTARPPPPQHRAGSAAASGSVGAGRGGEGWWPRPCAPSLSQHQPRTLWGEERGHRRAGVTHSAGAAAPVLVAASGPAHGRHLVRRHSIRWGPLFVNCPRFFNRIDCSFVLGQVSKCRCSQRGALVLFSGQRGSRRLPLRPTPPRLPLPRLPLQAAASTAWCYRGPRSCGVALWGSRRDGGSPHSPLLDLSNPWEGAWPGHVKWWQSRLSPCTPHARASHFFPDFACRAGGDRGSPRIVFHKQWGKRRPRVLSLLEAEGNTGESRRLWEKYRDSAPNTFSPHI